MNTGTTPDIRGNEKAFRLLSYILVFLMMASAAMTVGILIQNVLPAWHAGIIAGFLLFIVIDRLYTYRQLRSLTPLSSEWAMAIGGQWLLILLLMRFLLSYANGLDSFRADLSLFCPRIYCRAFHAGVSGELTAGTPGLVSLGSLPGPA